ncbi:MAG: GtrA family protein [bacterium]|nr:GtrA family protein [bacterium]
MKDILLIIDKIFGRYAVIVRYLFSGGTAFATDIILLYILREYFGVSVAIAVVIAFIFAFAVSFLMMKHVTFQDGSSGQTHKQLVAYFGVAIFNLFLNSFLVFLFIEKMDLWYIFSQVVASLIIAVWNFFIYKYLIFIKPVLEAI